MKTNSYLLLIVFGGLFLSCEKVVDIDLNDDDTAIVVESQLKAGVNDFMVKLSQTTNYFDNSLSPTVSGATVTLKDLNTDSIFYLSELGNGLYVLSNYLAIASRKYRLEVNVQGKQYLAESTLPKSVNLDSLSYEYEEASVFGEAGYTVYCELDDPINEKNYYRVVVTVNGELRNKAENIFLFDDGFTNGNHIKIPLFRERFKPGDVVTMELQCLDQKNYKYLEAVAQLASGEGQASTAPANPISNFNGGAFGYFSCYSSSSVTIQLPD